MVNSNKNDDVSFRGIDLATILRKKYGRSYDVRFIKKVSILSASGHAKLNYSYRMQQVCEDGLLSRTYIIRKTKHPLPRYAGIHGAPAPSYECDVEVSRAGNQNPLKGCFVSTLCVQDFRTL